MGLHIDEINAKYGVKVYMMIRGELTIIPNEHIVTAENDILIVNTEKLIKAKEKKGGKNKR